MHFFMSSQLPCNWLILVKINNSKMEHVNLQPSVPFVYCEFHFRLLAIFVLIYLQWRTKIIWI